MSLESAYSTIEKLVNDFKANERHYLAADYSESQARLDFIDKLFIALGWDVNHEHQKNPYEQEVKVERRVKDKETQKRADYAFFLEPNYRDPKFYVEAKKPSRSLANQYDYFQAIRYGWNAGTPLVVLTDFEEFHILDSRYKPDIKYTTQRKILSFHYTEYTDKEKFAKLYYLFSREAVGNGSIEKFAEDLPKPRGKAVQKGLFPGAYQSIDESFLEELDEIRNTLARSFKKKNPSLTSEELTEATQRTIDRLVFIRFLEDMLIEGEHHISSYGNKGTAWGDFITDCRSLNAKYNGIVFKEHFIDRLPLTKGEIQRGSSVPHLIKGGKSLADSGAKGGSAIAPDDKDFAQICEELSHVNTPYNFNSIPIHILGSIYERFLGKVVHATDKRVTIEEKPEVRKAGGVYYTPQYIVKYIVDNTVGKLIEGKTPAEISKLRFADISCGSGSFLITVYDTLLRYHSKYYQLNPKEAKADGCIFSNGLWVLSLKQKRQILLNNVYGVDIDHQAVEVTQLSLYLKLLEDETLATANEMQAMFKEKILPDLSKNIICGNSLIGTDIYDGNMFPGDEEKKINAMNFEDAFPEIMKNGGFDAIVGNPPWIDIKGLNPLHVKYYFKKYVSTENRINVYSIFIEKSFSLLNRNSCLGYIIPNSILYQSSYSKLRNLILSHYGIELIIRLPDNTFKNVKAESNIIIFNKNLNKTCKCIIYDRNSEISSINPNEAIELKEFETNKWLNNSYFVFDIFTNKKVTELINKIDENKIYFHNVCDFTLGITPYDKYKGHSQKQIKERVFHSDHQVDASYKKLLAGGDVNRYFVKWNGKDFLKYGKWLGAPREHKFFINERILVRQIVSGKPLRIYAAYTNEELYNVQSIFNIIKKVDTKLNIKFILGVLNSSLMNFYHSNKYLDLSKNLFQKILIQNCKNFPIPNIDNFSEVEQNIYNKIIEYVEQIISSKNLLNDSTTDKDKTFYENKCSSLDRQIDRLVYELYGLTEEEIKVVEGE